MGTEIIINPKPEQTKPPIVRPINPATVTINNLNITTNGNEAENDKEEKDNDYQPESKKEYKPKEDVKRIQVRHKQNWFTLKFQNCDEFYEFFHNIVQ